MATMQAQNYLSAVSDTVVLQNAGKRIGSGCSSAQMATGRKGLDVISAPIGGVNRVAGYYSVIFPSQIVPSLTQIFGGICASLLRKTGRDPSRAKDRFSLDQFAHMGE